MAGSTLPVAIVSDGVTDLSFEVASETPDKLVERSIRTSSGGKQKIQTAGYRIQVDVKLRMTPSEYNSIKVLLTNGALQYLYTPLNATTNDIYIGAEIPIVCSIDEDVKDFDNTKINHVNFTVRSIKLFNC